MQQVMELTVLQLQTSSFGKTKSTGRYRVSDGKHGQYSKDSPDLYTGGIPRFFKRCAVTRELYDLIIELRPSMTSAGLAEHFKREKKTNKKYS
jgi:hypothetical protein